MGRIVKCTKKYKKLVKTMRECSIKKLCGLDSSNIRFCINNLMLTYVEQRGNKQLHSWLLTSNIFFSVPLSANGVPHHCFFLEEMFTKLASLVEQ